MGGAAGLRTASKTTKSRSDISCLWVSDQFGRPPDHWPPAHTLPRPRDGIIPDVSVSSVVSIPARAPVFQILRVNNLTGCVISTIAVLPVWQMPSPMQWSLLVVLGLLMICAQTLFLGAMARADASFVAPFSYTTLIFAALYDFGWFGAVPDGISILGITIILTGATLLAWREGRRI